MSTASKVAANKLKHPELYCPHPRCLWRTGGGRCPRHQVGTIARLDPAAGWPTEENAPLVPIVDTKEEYSI